MAMQFKDELLIAAPRARVYAALNDTATLKAGIPGCKELIRNSDTDLTARVMVRLGPIKATFKGNVILDQSGAPDTFTLTGEGSGGIAGFAKGRTEVTLEDRGAETLLRYTGSVDVAGKIAQLGNRMITSFAKRLANHFFAAVAAKVTADQALAP